MDAIRSLCDRCVVMNAGRLIAAGPPAAVLADPEVIRAYLGRRRCLRSPASPSPTASIAPLDDVDAATSARARSWSSWAPTAPASPRCSRRWPGWCAPARRARSRSAAATCSALPPHEIVEAGLALVPEGRGIFGELTVRENLLLGAYPAAPAADEAAILERVLALFPRLGRAARPAPRAP